MNKLIITGHLGRDPEARYTPTGKLVSSFSVAVNHKYTNSAGEKVTNTVWVYVSAWGRMAEVAREFLAKGSHVLLEGRLKEPFVFKSGDKASNQMDATYLEILSWQTDQPSEEGEAVPLADEDEFPF